MKTLYDEKQLFATLDDAGICRVELNNPDQLNALNTTMAEGAVELAAIIRSSAARVVIFSGRGRAFSAGGDPAYLIELTQLPKEQSAAAMLKFYRSYLALFTLPLPTIAHINGACVGAGFCLALACDMRFAVSGSKVGTNFVRIGLNPGMAAEFWAQGENSPLIREMLLTGKIYSSSEPRLKLLFNQVASPQEIASVAAAHGCRSVAFTYNDPVIFAEYAMDVADACHALGVQTVAVTAGYMHAAPRREFYAKMDAANVDLKGFSEAFYFQQTGAHLAPVLDTLQFIVHDTGCWLEITTLLIPGHNDGDAELHRIARRCACLGNSLHEELRQGGAEFFGNQLAILGHQIMAKKLHANVFFLNQGADMTFH